MAHDPETGPESDEDNGDEPHDGNNDNEGGFDTNSDVDYDN
jgi:hypothetical protein